jgi:peptide/nickel transport system permease protein
MRAFLFRRLLALIPTLLFATIIVFALIRLIPGDIIDMMMSQHDVGMQEVTRATIEKALGLDKPIYVQYILWLKNLLIHGDLGESLWKGTAVTEEIMDRLPVTIELGLIGLIIGLLVAIPVGIYSAIRQDTLGDYVGRTFSILGMAIPGFWLGTMVVIYPAVWWNWSPPIDLVAFSDNPWEHMQTFLIPGALLGISLSAVTMRMTRAMMLEVLRQDYIRTAWAKGLKERIVILRHGVKNALIPVVTLIGLYVPILIGGTVVFVQIFNLPGLGVVRGGSKNQRDYPHI